MDTAVYRLFDENGALLYVGMSSDAEARIRAHRSTSVFGWRIRSTTVSDFPTRAAAAAAEREAIRDEAPLFNVVGRFGDRSAWTLEHYRAFLQVASPRRSSNVVRRRIELIEAEARTRFGAEVA